VGLTVADLDFGAGGGDQVGGFVCRQPAVQTGRLLLAACFPRVTQISFQLAACPVGGGGYQANLGLRVVVAPDGRGGPAAALAQAAGPGGLEAIEPGGRRGDGVLGGCVKRTLFR